MVYPLAEVAADVGPFIRRIGPTSRVGCEACAGARHRTTGSGGQPCGCVCHTGGAEALRTWDTTGEPYLTSSIAYELALAIHEGFAEIHLYGVDLTTEGEYAWQKPGVEFLMGVAAGRGITVVVPDNCPMLRGGLYGRGFMSNEPEHFGYEQLAHRLAAQQNDLKAVQQQLAEASGARGEFEFLLAQAVAGMDPQALEAGAQNATKGLEALAGSNEMVRGGLGETQRWFQQRVAELEAKRQRVDSEIHAASGAHRALVAAQGTMVPGAAHERTEGRRKALEQALVKLQQQAGGLQGAIQETAYWLHQTMAGQDADEAMRALHHGDEGPLTDLQVLQSSFSGSHAVLTNVTMNIPVA